MTNLDFGNTPKPEKIFGTVNTSVNLAEALGNNETVKRAFSAIPQVSKHFYRDNVIVLDGDTAEYVFFVLKGVVRSCKIFKGGVRNIVAFYLPGDLFGWTDLEHSLSIEATTDTEVLFIKRSALLSIASQQSAVARFLLRSAIDELGRAQDHILLMSKSAKCRVATFFTELWIRLGRAKYLDIPMSHLEIADHLGLSIETVSRAIGDLERSKMLTRMSSKRLLVCNRLTLGHMMN
jgi:CRP/FNR family transcriptional regulator, nitrogen fixation regulation protein